jgi:hypothetical protein
MNVLSCECCVLSNRGLCDVPIARPEETCVWSSVIISIYTCRGSTDKIYVCFCLNYPACKMYLNSKVSSGRKK